MLAGDHSDRGRNVSLLSHLRLLALGLLELEMEGLHVALDFFDSLDDLFLEDFLAMLHF